MENSSKLTTSIVIRALNEEKYIGKLLFGLKQQSKLPEEIILVDSGSTDNTLLIASSYDIKIHQIRKEEFTFGRALNIGCKLAQNQILIFLSAHVYPPHKDWLVNLLQPFEDELVVSTYGKQRGNQKTKFSENRIFLSWFPEEVTNKGTKYFCNNANCAIRRSIWKKYPYDEDLTGLEDIDWAKKQYLLGKKIVYVPESEIIHVHDENWMQIRNRYRREAIALKKIEPNISMNFVNMIYLILLSVFSDFLAVKSIKSFRSNCISIILFRFNQYFGTMIGMNSRNNNINDLRQTFYYPSKSFQNSSLKKLNKKDKKSVGFINYEGF